ncbi:MAG: hypothetical protein KF791_20625 [Verrucomicrobiae bacterium]|nr:hypothetical protein [Verrucomicrobiae bacterium]
MKLAPPDTGDTAISPPVQLEFIQNQIGQPEAASLEDIEAYHRALFLHQHAHEIEQCTQEEQVHRDRLLHLESRLAAAQARLVAMDPLLPVRMGGEPDVHPSAPWNGWDRTMFAAGALGIVVLLVFGVLNISFNLLESGLITFTENPVRAYFWAALLPVGALGVKVGWDLIPGRTVRSAYLWVCLGLGLVGVLVWMIGYAATYPRLSQSAADQLESVSVLDAGAMGPALTAGGATWLDMATVVSQGAAEVFLSAVLGMYLTTLYVRHRPVRLAGNPQFLQWDEERSVLEQGVALERRALADAVGARTRLENQLSALLLYARSLFFRETRDREDRVREERRLLDGIASQLRRQLEGVEQNRAGGREPGLPRRGSDPVLGNGV